MMKLCYLILLISIKSLNCRDIWDIFGPTYPEISNLTLIKGQPLQLQQNYTQLQISDLEGTLYSDSLSQLSPVTSLKIFWHKIDKIEDGAICSLPTLKKFELNCLRDASVSTFTKNMLQNCNRLEELHLLGDILNHLNLETDALENLKSLKVLHLRYFNLRHLKRDYFKSLKSLTNLTLVDSMIEDIASDSFDDLNNLKEVQIAFNFLSHLPSNLFKNTPKVSNLVLYANQFETFSWSVFDGLSSLKILDLRGNYIKNFDGKAVSKYLPNLEVLLMFIQVKSCDEKTKLNQWAKLHPNVHFVYYLRLNSKNFCEL